MRQKLVSIGDDYWIENDQGERVFKVDGKALRIRKTLILEDSHGSELLKIQERVARVRDTMEIEDRDGHTVATVKKALITPLRDRWTVKVADGADLDVKGNIVDHEYTIEDRITTALAVASVAAVAGAALSLVRARQLREPDRSVYRLPLLCLGSSPAPMSSGAV
jgi:uncharacterized protein YxjI